MRYKRIENRSSTGQVKHSDWLTQRQKSIDNLKGSVLPLPPKLLQLSRLRYWLPGNPDGGRSFLVTRGVRALPKGNPSSDCAPGCYFLSSLWPLVGI